MLEEIPLYRWLRIPFDVSFEKIKKDDDSILN